MDYQLTFQKWFSPQKPKSYKNWDERLDAIKEAYNKSFDRNIFEIDPENIEHEITEINKNLENRFNVQNKTFAIFNQKAANGIPQAIIKTWFISFLRDVDKNANNEEMVEDTVENKISTKNSFHYEVDLQNALNTQIEKLFPEYKIFGNNGEGIQYKIGGKKIDLLLEHKENDQLLVIELKAGTADFRAFGQIAMYIGLLSEKFTDRVINGVIIAKEIDYSLIKASLINKNIKLMAYEMEFNLEEII